MYPLDEAEQNDADAPPEKRSCTIADKLASLEDNSGSKFLVFDNVGPCDRPLFSGDEINPEYCLSSPYFVENNNFATDFPDQRTYHQLTVPTADSLPPETFGMPYVFPAQPRTADGRGNSTCSESSGSLAEFEKKEFPLSSVAVKEGSESKGPQSDRPGNSVLASTVFCKVPSRTSLQKPKLLTVSVGEIFRRVFGPEMMNVSLLGSYLRRAKEKDGGKTLRDQLMGLGMNVPMGRRKNGNTTTWTSFVEEETAVMAVDLDIAARKFFPVQSFAQTIKERQEKLGCNNDDICAEASNVRKVLAIIRQIFTDDCSPIHGREVAQYVLNPELQNGLYKYSCATHGFGTLALISAIDLFEALMEALLEDAGVSSEDGNSSSSIDSV